MQALRLLMAVMIVAAVPAVLAEEKNAPADAINQTELERWALQLGSEDSETRNAAHARLVEYGSKADAALQKVLDANKEHPRLKENIQAFRDLFRPDEHTIRGLKLVLHVDRKEVGTGESLVFRTELVNLSDKSISVSLSDVEPGVGLESGAFLVARKIVRQENQDKTVDSSPTCMAERCKWKHLILTLKPGTGRTFSCSCAYPFVGAQSPPGPTPALGFNADKYLFLPVTPGKSNTFAMRLKALEWYYDPRYSEPMEKSAEGPGPAGLNWTGELPSNEVTVIVNEGRK